MPHLRRRIAHELIKKSLTWSPAVGLLGMRQTGKTTLLREFAASYVNFDLETERARFERLGSGALQGRPPLGLDEVQKHPPVFDLLKHEIDERRAPGRYLLTGSVRFSSRRAIRESLTGRIDLIDIYPMTLAESHQKPPPKWVSLLSAKPGKPRASLEAWARSAWATEAMMTELLDKGGLPGICFKRDSAVRAKQFSNHLDTLFGRDLQLIVESRLSIDRLRELFGVVCASQGEPVNYSRLARIAGVSIPTLQKLLAAMEGLFLIRPLGKTYYAEDQGLATFAGQFLRRNEKQEMQRALYSEIRAQIGYAAAQECALSSHRTKAGSELPFVIRRNNGLHIAIGVEVEEAASEKNLKAIAWYRKRHPSAVGVIFHRGPEGFIAGNDILCVPWTWVA